MSEWQPIESVPISRWPQQPTRVLLFFPRQIVADNETPQRQKRFPGYMEYVGATIEGYAQRDVPEDKNPWDTHNPRRIWWYFDYGWDQHGKYLSSVVGPIEPTHWMPLPAPPTSEQP